MNNKGVELIVSDKNIFKALEILNIPKGYMLLCKGVNLDYLDHIYNKQRKLEYDKDYRCYYSGLEVKQMNSQMSTILIIKQSDLLTYEYIDASEDSEFAGLHLTPLENSKNHLYSDIDYIINSHEDNERLGINSIPTKLGRCVKVYENANMQFIRIRVESNVNDGNMLAEMKQFKEYFKKQK